MEETPKRMLPGHCKKKKIKNTTEAVWSINFMNILLKIYDTS